jgi:hypothetical protein
LRRPNPNQTSLMLALSLVALGFVWIVFSQYAVPPLIHSAYSGESLPIFNRIISGQASHPVAEYLSAWDSIRWRVLLDFSLLGLLVVLVLRPEFQRALWGSQADHPAVPVFSEEKAVPRQTRSHLVALALYLALAVTFTLPSSLHPTRALLGDGKDNYMHAWFLWEFAQAVAHGTNPFRTDLIFYPFGANLSWATTDPLGGAVALPVSLSFGPVLAYNLSVILQLTLSAFFARLLCLRISQHQAAATIGGMIFGFSPLLLAHAVPGHLSLLTAFPIPLYVLALDKILREEKPSWKEGSILGFALLLTALANIQYTVICFMFTVVVLGVDFGLERAALLKRVWMPLLVSAATFLICFSPLLLMMLGDSHAFPNPRPITDAEQYSADLLGFFVPSKSHSFLGQYVGKMPVDFFANGIEGTAYTGFLALLLGAAGFWRAGGRQRRWAGRAAVAGILFAVLSLGPTVHFLGKPTAIPAPASLLYKVKFTRFIEPGRLAIITMLCLSLLATFGVMFLLNKLERRSQRSLLLYIIGAGIVLEFITVPFPAAAIGDPARSWIVPKTTQRCTLPPRLQDCTVLTVPMFDKWHYNSAMWMQMMDGGRYRLVDGAVSPYVPDLLFDRIPIVRSLRKMSSAQVDAAHDREFADSLVQELNVCAVVVFDASERPLELDYVREVFGTKESIVGSCAVFEIASEPKNALLEPKRAVCPPGFALGAREVYR